MTQAQVLCVLPVNVVEPRKYCCILQNQLKKDLAQLQQESQKLQILEAQCNEKLESFLEVSKEVDNKLCYLWSLGDRICAFDYPKSMQVYGFANRISEAWRCGDNVIAQDVQAVQIASSTVTNVALDVVVDKVKSDTKQAWENFPKATFHVNCIGYFTELYNQINNLIVRLQDGNQKLRYFLSISKAIPYLKDLETVIDKYTENVTQYMTMQSSSIKNLADKSHAEEANGNSREDLSAFTYVVKLLTGELLGHDDYLDHHSQNQPIVRHEMPEIPKSAYINPFSPAPNYPNTVQNWKYVQMIPNESLFPDGIHYPGAETGVYYYPVILQQPVNYSQTTMPQSPNSFHKVDLTGESMIESDQRDNIALIQEIIPQSLSNTGNDRYVNKNNVVSVVLLEDTGRTLISNTLDGTTTIENVIKIVESGRSSKDMTITRRRRITRKIRTSSTFIPEANDLQPIKIPTLKQNLLTPLIED